MPKIQYNQAINQTLHQLMKKDHRVFLIGQGVTSPWYVGQTTNGLLDKFGSRRVIDTPVSENGITGVAVGAALAAMRPILIFPRMDFMYYAMDQLVNHAGSWHYMFGGQLNVPLTVWAIINRGGEQAAQHSQSLQAMLSHIPGFKVVMPSTAYDAKGLLVSAVEDDDPVIYIDDRWLYELEDDVPEELYSIPIGEGMIRRKGKTITVAASSYMVTEAIKAADSLADEGIDVEVIDLRSLKPLDKQILINSVKKTGRFIVVDAGWPSSGIGAEVSAIVGSEAFEYLNAPIMRVSLPDSPAPASSPLEAVYYPKAKTIVSKIRELVPK
jgi:pyruvate dehydrogenase E1 component beta subunit|tara:strand:- start:3370 stop:4347 length:978 start_codon:yes stop_codon:yes gene_type:complete